MECLILKIWTHKYLRLITILMLKTYFFNTVLLSFLFQTSLGVFMSFEWKLFQRVPLESVNIDTGLATVNKN